jgi:hypothetical protein
MARITAQAALAFRQQTATPCETEPSDANHSRHALNSSSTHVSCWLAGTPEQTVKIPEIGLRAKKSDHPVGWSLVRTLLDTVSALPGNRFVFQTLS